MEKPQKQEQERKSKKDGGSDAQLDQRESQSQSGSQESISKQSFVVGDDEVDEESYDGSYERSKRHKSKKKDKKGKKDKKKKKKKSRRDGSDDDSVYADDLEVIDAQVQPLMRLRKNKDKNVNENEEDEQFEEEQEEFDDVGGEQEDFDAEYEHNYYDGESEQSYENNRKHEEADLDDLLDERVRKQYFAETTDKEIVQMNLPERQIMKYKNYSKITQIPIETVQRDFQLEERSTEARWIYERLKQQNYFQAQEERQCKAKIENVLLAMHREHLQIMYIYYYRKKIWADALNLNLLMKIEEIDEEWMTFKREFKSLKDDITSVIPSFQFQDVPKSLEQALNSCTDLRQLKYFKDYTNFVMSKRKPDINGKSSKHKKLQIIKQICDSGIDRWIADKNVFLSPSDFFTNFRKRVQEHKPKTPSTLPNRSLVKALRQKGRSGDDTYRDSRNSERRDEAQLQQKEDKLKDWSAYPLISPENRISTLINYLAIELFDYPELRKSLKEKYYKKLLISTTPTPKGSHYITIYNSFFPIKRIKDKPISSFKKEMWVLAREAQKLGLINIQLKFEWQLSSTTDKKNIEADLVYLQMVKNYFDLSSAPTADDWNLLRKQVLIRMLTEHFFPAFIQEIKEDLHREGTKEIIEACCQKFRQQLNKAPNTKEGQPITILAMVLEQEKLGIAYVDEHGKEHSTTSMELRTDDQLKRFVGEDVLKKLIEDHKPDMILVAANCRRAQTLRKELRNPSLFTDFIYCEFGEYEVPSLIANKNIIQGVSTQKCILQAISMARLKKNPMAQILGLWSDNLEENGVYSMNLHPLQKYIDKRKLIDALEKVAIEIVNQVGIDIEAIRNSDHSRNVLQFISGLGPRKAFDLIERVKQAYPPTRRHLGEIVKSQYVYVNCSPFIKFERVEHVQILQRNKGSKTYEQTKKEKHSKKNKDGIDRSEINLLDITRIPQEWYSLTQRLFLQAIKLSNMPELKHKKGSNSLSDEQIAIREMFKHPERLRNVQWDSRRDQNKFYDENLVKAQIICNFKDPRDPEKFTENREIFYSLLKQTPETLKKYMVVTAKVLSVNRHVLNVVIPENGLFGYIKLQGDKPGFDRNSSTPQYEKGMFIKAMITGFPFDERRQRDRQEGDHEQELLKVDMSLTFPHRSEDKNHDCHRICFVPMLKEIHPNIDLDRENFDLEKQPIPVVEVKQEAVVKPKAEFKRISHPKFKNISMATAIEEVKQLKVGDFIIRPSTEGSNFLTITWHFYKNIVVHIKIKLETRPEPGSLPTFRILDKAQDKVYASIDEMVEKYLKPMNNLVQDVISNKKFTSGPLEHIEEKIKADQAREGNYIQYYFGCSQEYPGFFVLMYLYKEKKPTKELIRVKNDGLYFHDQTFHSLRELISFFKQNLKQKKYQNYVKSTAIRK